MSEPSPDDKATAIRGRSFRLAAMVWGLTVIGGLLGIALLVLVGFLLFWTHSRVGLGGPTGVHSEEYWLLGIVFVTLSILVGWITHALAKVASNC